MSFYLFLPLPHCFRLIIKVYISMHKDACFHFQIFHLSNRWILQETSKVCYICATIQGLTIRMQQHFWFFRTKSNVPFFPPGSKIYLLHRESQPTVKHGKQSLIWKTATQNDSAATHWLSHWGGRLNVILKTRIMLWARHEHFLFSCFYGITTHFRDKMSHRG